MNLKIKVLSFGKSSGEPYSDDIQRFVKMSRPWATVEFMSLKSTDSSSDPTGVVLAREAKLIRKYFSSGATVVTLGEEGKELTSYEFANVLRKASDESRELIFVIGSAFGIDPELKKESSFLLSLSRLTFPYKLCKLIFAEQIYRGLSICNNHPYHKE